VEDDTILDIHPACPKFPRKADLGRIARSPTHMANRRNRDTLPTALRRTLACKHVAHPACRWDFGLATRPTRALPIAHPSPARAATPPSRPSPRRPRSRTSWPAPTGGPGPGCGSAHVTTDASPGQLLVDLPSGLDFENRDVSDNNAAGGIVLRRSLLTRAPRYTRATWHREVGRQFDGRTTLRGDPEDRAVQRQSAAEQSRERDRLSVGWPRRRV